MTFKCLVVLVLMLFVAVSCRNSRRMKSDDLRPLGSPTAEALRASYARNRPETRTGVVVAVNNEYNMVAVGDINPREFRERQVVSFVDPHDNTLTSGTVLRIVPDKQMLHVKYDRKAGTRAPREGDIMVRYPPAI